MRLTKNGIKYTYDGDKLLREEHPGYALTYFYGIDGIIGFTDSTQKNCAFFYRKNLQGRYYDPEIGRFRKTRGKNGKVFLD